MERLITGAKRLGIDLRPQQVKKFQVYYEELVQWNEWTNLTAITDYEEVQIKHFLDSLTVALALSQDRPSLSVLDVGTGAGLPGVPLKILCPAIRLTLLDSVAKKTRFLHHLISRLDLDGIDILTARAEDLAHDVNYREKFDFVLSRAVAALPSLVELTLPFLRLGGIFVAQKKGQIEPGVERAARAIAILGGRLQEVKRVWLDESVEGRALIIIDKVIPTPERYPRRPGVPSRRPL